MDDIRESVDSNVTGCFGIRHNMRWCSFLMIALFSWVIVGFSIAMIVATVYFPADDIRYDQLVIWTNMLTMVVGVWLPTPKNKTSAG